MAKVLNLNVVFAEIDDPGGSVGRTAIDKRSVTDRRHVTSDGVAGDFRSDMKNHGSTDQAVYAYAREDYDWWETELGKELPSGLFGENLTTTGIDWNSINVGTTIRIGTALLQTSCPRIPCGTFGRWVEQEKWVKRFTEAARPGSYLRVLEPGDLGAGDDIEIVNDPGHGVSIRDIAQVYTGTREPAQLKRVFECADTPEDTRVKAELGLANL